MLLARAPRTTIWPFSALRRDAGVLIDRSPRRYAPVTDVGSFSSCAGVPWKITCPPCSPAPGPEVHDVVGLADRLFVVLDDDHGVAEVAQAAERGQQRAVVALVQANRRLVEHVEHAGEVRSDLRRQADALRLAARQRVRRCGRR